MSLLYSCFNPFKYQFEIHKILKATFFLTELYLKNFSQFSGIYINK